MNPKDQITTGQWMAQRTEVKMALVAVFGIPRTGFSQTVTDATGHSSFITDGYTHKDLSAITYDRLLTYLGEAKPEDNIHTLFLKAVERVQLAPVSIESVVEKKEVHLEEPTVPLRQEVEEEIPPLHRDPGPDGLKCDFCEYHTANPRALHMHRVAKHRR